MGAKSSKYVDIYEWIVDVINSSETIEHFISTRNLIDNFQKKGHNPDEDRFEFTLCILKLKRKLNEKIVNFKQNEIRKRV